MEDNILIAKFMGYKESGDSEYLIHPESDLEHSINDSDWFLYSTSWDWLMPVVDKIESLHNDGIDVTIYTDGTVIEDWRTNTELVRMTKAEIGFDKKIEHTYKAVVEFINNISHGTDTSI